jgi:hypothetical protein
MTTEIEVCPFDGFGKIAAPPAEIFAKLKKHEPERFARLSAMLTANIEANDAEAALTKNQNDLYASVTDAQRARVAFEKLKPKTTHVEEVRRVIAARAGTPLPPVPIDPKAEPAALAADDADALVLALRSDLETARIVLKNKRAALAETILRWQGINPRRDTASLVRENVKRETERKLARIAQGMSAEEAVAERVYLEPIDRVLASPRGNANVNWKRPAGSWRGGPAPRKLPSE